MKLRVLALVAVLAVFGVLLFVFTRPDDARASVVPSKSVEAQEELALEPVELAGLAPVTRAERASNRAALATDGPWSRWIVPIGHTGAPLATFDVAVVARDGSRTTHASDEAMVRDLVPAGGVLVVIADGHCPRFVDVDRLRELGAGPHELRLAPSATVRLTANIESQWYRDVLFVQVGAKARRRSMPNQRLVYAHFREEAGVVLPPELVAKAAAQRDGDPYTLFALALQKLARPEGSADDHADAIARAQASRYYMGATAPLDPEASSSVGRRAPEVAPQHQMWSVRRAVDPIALPLEFEWVLPGDVVVDVAAAASLELTGPDVSRAIERSEIFTFDASRHASYQHTSKPGDDARFSIEFQPYAEIRGRAPSDAADVRFSFSLAQRDDEGVVQSSVNTTSVVFSESNTFTTGPVVPGFYIVEVRWQPADESRVHVRRAIDLTEGGLYDFGLIDIDDDPTLVIEPRFFDPDTGRDWTTADGIDELRVSFIIVPDLPGLGPGFSRLDVRCPEDPRRPLVIRGLPTGEVTVRLGGVRPREAGFIPDVGDAHTAALTSDVYLPIDVPLRRSGFVKVVLVSAVPVREKVARPHPLAWRLDGTQRMYVPLEHVPDTDTFEGEIRVGAGAVRLDVNWNDVLEQEGVPDEFRAWAASQVFEVFPGDANRFELHLAESARALLPAHVLPDAPPVNEVRASNPPGVELFLADVEDKIRHGRCTEWIDGRPHVVGLLPNRPYRFRSEQDRDVWIEFVTGPAGSLVTVDR